MPKSEKNRLGYRRVQKWLKREKGMNINHKKVYRITRRNNLLSVIRRRKSFKYKPNGNLKYENILNRKTHSDVPNTDWVTDISYIIMPGGTAYLSAIRDLCGQFIVAYRTAQRQDYSLIRNTIADAMQAGKPERPPLLYSDALALTDEFIHYYNYERIQGNGLTPYEERQEAFSKKEL